MSVKWILDASNPNYRTIRATQPIAKNELIFETEALALTPYQSQRTHFCGYCFQESQELYKCATCNVLYYCNPDCQKKDWQAYHKQECSGIQALYTLDLSNELILSLRLYLFYKQNASFRDSILNMKSHEDSYSESEIAAIKESAKKIAEILKEEIDQIPTIFSIILKVKINFFTIEKPSYIMNMSVGTGFYQGEANFFNHSCLPNSLKIYTQRKLRIFAAEEISPGQEIFICYDDIMGKPYNWRQNYLKQHYKMTCLCRLCAKEGQNSQEEIYPNIGLKCNKCPEKSEILNNKCKTCHFSFKYSDLSSLHHSLESSLEPTLATFKKFEESHSFLEDLKRNHLETNSYLIEAAVSHILTKYLAQCFDTHTKELYKLLKFYVKNHNKWFEIQIPSFGFKINELSRFAVKLGKGKKARKYCEEAWEKLSVHFGEECREMRELGKRRVMVQGLLDAGSEVRKHKVKGILKID